MTSYVARLLQPASRCFLCTGEEATETVMAV
jgi:phosphoribosyl-ATP pyrophosphohydrolase